jgi:hypothetical protein
MRQDWYHSRHAAGDQNPTGGWVGREARRRTRAHPHRRRRQRHRPGELHPGFAGVLMQDTHIRARREKDSEGLGWGNGGVGHIRGAIYPTLARRDGRIMGGIGGALQIEPSVDFAVFI